MDKTWLGFALGLFLPVLTTIVFYKYGYTGDLPISQFLSQLFYLRGIPMLLAVSCLPNLALFSIFVNTNKLLISRGLFLATLLFAFGIVVLKFIF